MRSRTIILLLASLSLLSCSPRALREAQEVVAQADSLRAEGQMYADSAQLAQAYITLHARRDLYADEYAHACYHYGRLLREKDNPVEAMQVFIRASHARTQDYHILGRVYSNMGEIAYLANEHQLSYDIYGKAAEVFASDGDSLSFYLCLYRMAFAKAVLGDNNVTDSILLIIEHANIDNPTLTNCTYVTYAEKYLYTQHYDSAVYFAHLALNVMPNECTSMIILAQAFSYMEEKDSAAYYAEQVLENSNDLGNQNNALYILTNDDMTRDLDLVRQTAAERADIQKILEIRQGKLSQAVQLLEQDILRKPDRSWLYAIVGTVGVMSAIIAVYVYRKRRKRQLLSQHINALEAQAEETTASIRKQIEEHCAILQNSATLKEDLFWHNYDAMCQVVDHQFYFLARKLQQTYNLSDREIQLCVLTLLDLSYDQIAELLIYAPNGIGKFKVRVAKKIGTTAKNLREFLINMATGG